MTQSVITLALAAVLALASLNISASFATSEDPHGVISITFDDSNRNTYDYAFPLLAERGMAATFYVITNLIRDYSGDSSQLSLEELHALQDNGCEVSSHSHTHAAFVGLSESEIRYECATSKAILQANGFSAANFAYPYGDRNNYTDSIVADYFRSGRSAYDNPYMIELPANDWLLTAVEGETGTPDVLSYLQEIVDEVYSTNGWAIIFFHNVIPGANNEDYTISSEDFESFLDYILYKEVPTVTVNQGLDLTSPPATPPSVEIAPASASKYVGQSQAFTSSISEGNPPFSYQWYLNGTEVAGANASTWVLTPRTAGQYIIYLNVTDGLNFEVKSNVADVVFSSVYILMTAEPTPESFSKGQTVTLVASVFNCMNPALESSLSLAITGPDGYGYFDVQPIRVAAGSVGECCFVWAIPDVAGKYVVEVGLAPSLLTAYDVLWLDIA